MGADMNPEDAIKIRISRLLKSSNIDIKNYVHYCKKWRDFFSNLLSKVITIETLQCVRISIIYSISQIEEALFRYVMFVKRDRNLFLKD